MKRSLLSLGAAIMALGGIAATPNQQSAPAPFRLGGNSEADRAELPAITRHAGDMKKAPSRIGQAEDIITEVQGRRQNITYTGSGFFLWYGLQYNMYRDQTVANHMVYGDNDEVYFYNMLPNLYPPNCENYFVPYYVKGTKVDDTKIVIDLPQTIYYNDDWGEGYDLVMFKWEKQPYEGQMTEYWWPQEDIDSVTVHIEKDGSMWFDIPDDCLLGVGFTTDHFYAEYGTYDLSMTNFYEEMVTLPEGYGAVEDYWWHNTGVYGYPVAWAPGENEWYLRGLSESMPDAWVKGTISPDDPFTIKIAQDQYIGVYEGYHIWTKAILLEFDETGDPIAAELTPEDYEYELVWDPVANTVTPKDPNVYLALNAAKERVYYLDAFIDFNLVHQSDYAGTPQNPFGMKYFLMMDMFGYNSLQIYIPAVSTEGKLLKTDDLYYVVYLDDEPWTFEPDEYGTESPIVEIPWNLDLYHIDIPYGMPAMREVSIFVEGFSTIGVQSVYKHNGVETRSDIITGSVVRDPSAVDSMDSGKKVSDVKYFNLSGTEVANPSDGIFVKRVTYDDGTVKTFKAAVR